MKKLSLLLSCSILLSACGGGSSGSSTPVTLTVPSSAPTISAGPDVIYPEGEVVPLSAIVNSAQSTTVIWTQLAGPAVTIENPTTLTPSFLAPELDTNDIVILELSVDDGINAPVTDIINITIEDREIRAFDGAGNNLSQPDWGAALTHLGRIGPADYDDSVSTLAGASRPSARLISNIVSNQDEGVSLPNSFGGTDFVWQWGQFLDHDIGLTEGTEEEANITVPSGDIFFDPTSTGTAIISFNRALFDTDTGTSVISPRQQDNEITAWIDGSQVYGHTNERAAALRVGADSPYLAASAGNLLPFNTSGQANAAAFVTDPASLFLAGDVRANEQIGLAVMHTLFVREHNRLAAIIEAQRPEASGEEVFQATRRLVVAKLQKITYEEFLPALLGTNALPAYSGYKDNVFPGLFNEFSAAAFRLGHSMLNEELLRLDASGDEIAGGHLSLRNSFFTAPSILISEGDLDPILRGLASQPHQRVDAKVITDIRNFLFGQPGSGGFDLASLNIQRGRDHGLPSYNAMRGLMGLSPVTSFADITSDTELQLQLFEAYGDVNDIDLWVGGLSEDAIAINGNQLGELFNAILVFQFTRLRDGDRFWYENDLTASELTQISNVTLAQIIRDNTGIDSEIQDNVFAVTP